jgi:hypothetical protein
MNLANRRVRVVVPRRAKRDEAGDVALIRSDEDLGAAYSSEFGVEPLRVVRQRLQQGGRIDLGPSRVRGVTEDACECGCVVRPCRTNEHVVESREGSPAYRRTNELSAEVATEFARFDSEDGFGRTLCGQPRFAVRSCRCPTNRLRWDLASGY